MPFAWLFECITFCNTIQDQSKVFVQLSTLLSWNHIHFLTKKTILWYYRKGIGRIKEEMKEKKHKWLKRNEVYQKKEFIKYLFLQHIFSLYFPVSLSWTSLLSFPHWFSTFIPHSPTLMVSRSLKYFPLSLSLYSPQLFFHLLPCTILPFSFFLLTPPPTHSLSVCLSVSYKSFYFFFSFFFSIHFPLLLIFLSLFYLFHFLFVFFV